MMKLKSITDREYEEWISQYPQRDFLQSSYEGAKMKHDGWDIYYLAGMQEETIQICAMIAIRPLMKIFRYAYLQRGPVYDWNNTQILPAFYEALKPFLKEKKCVYLETDPNIPLQERDKDGQLVPDGWNHFDVVQTYQKIGFEQLPLKVGYDMSKQCRWISVLDLRNQTADETFKAFASKTRQNVKNALKNQVKVRKLAREELPILYNIVKKTGERRHFSSLSLEFYQEQYDFFQDHAQAYYAYINLKEYTENLLHNIEEEKKNIQQAQEGLANNPHSKNSKNRLKSATNNLQSLEKRLAEAKELKEEHGDELGLAAAMFLFYGQQVVYLMSGSNDAYKKFKGPYALQWEMIQKALQEGYSFYNFYGISGLFEPDQDGYGVFDFKRGFNATVVELVGNFIYPLRPFIYKLFQLKQGR